MSRPSPDEFVPLPFFNWTERPLALPLDVDEVATALYLSSGDAAAAAELLKVSVSRLNRVIRPSPRLMRLKAAMLAPPE